MSDETPQNTPSEGADKRAAERNLTSAGSRRQRGRQLNSAMKRAQVAAAKKAVEFGQLLYVTRRGKVVGVDPYKIIRLADEESK